MKSLSPSTARYLHPQLLPTLKKLLENSRTWPSTGLPPDKLTGADVIPNQQQDERAPVIKRKSANKKSNQNCGNDWIKMGYLLHQHQRRKKKEERRKKKDEEKEEMSWRVVEANDDGKEAEKD